MIKIADHVQKCKLIALYILLITCLGPCTLEFCTHGNRKNSLWVYWTEFTNN